MKYFDRQEQLNRRLEGPEREVKPLLEAMLANRRLFNAEESDPPKVTEAIRFEQFPQDQMDPMDSPPTSGPEADVFELYKSRDGFDAPLEFQAQSWQTISERLDAVQKLNQTRGVLTTAPTGFGKTEAFMGPIVNDLSKNNIQTAIFVYPRTALLKDQFQRVLRLMHRVKQLGGKRTKLNCGVYYGDIPFYKDDVEESNDLYNPYSGVFNLTRSWETDENGKDKPFYLSPDSRHSFLNVSNSDISFSEKELILNRSSMVYDPPNIILTTLSSLENFSLKVNYNILKFVDAIVFDEVHLYNGVYGSHAANVIRNLRRLKDADKDSFLLVGSSATLESPTRFANKMFDLRPEEIDVIEPSDSDFKDKSHVEDFENYYFLLSNDDVSLASTYIQQSMLLGHSLLQPKNDDKRKMLSFIDSVSSVNQKFAQFRDADRTNRLWQYHVGTEEEDWSETANRMGFDFIDQPLNIDIDHSEVELSSSDIAGSDMLISTSSLEVGIDIGDLNIISQYHAPLNLSSFVQRAGRAGRDDDNSHIVTFLSQQEGDMNHFHRADRFLNADVTTPLNPNNPIVKWMHDSLFKYYLVSDRLEDPSQPGRTFLREYFVSEPEEADIESGCTYPTYYKFLSDPEDYIKEIIDTPPQNLFSNRPVLSLKRDVEQFKSDAQAELKPLADQLGMDASSLIQQTDPNGEVVSNLRDKALEALNELENRLEELQATYGTEAINEDIQEQVGMARLPEPMKTEVESITVQIICERVRSYIENLGVDRNKSNRDTGEILSEQCREARRILHLLDTVAGDAGDIHGGTDPELTFDYGAKKLDEFQDLYNAYRKGAGERMASLHDSWKKAYYLGECLDQLSSYYSTYGKSYESVYAVKYLLRSLYYFDRYLWMDGNDEEANVWYLPESYFGDAGTTFTRVIEDASEETESTEEPLHKLADQYYPYRGEFTSNGSDIQIFQPRTEIRNGEVYFDLKSEDEMSVRGIEEGVFQPESVSMKRVSDCSSGSGRGILAYCPHCLEILDGPSVECSRHEDRKFGTFYSEPRIETERKHTNPETSISQNLTLSDFQMTVALTGIDLDIRESKYIESYDSYVPKKQEPIDESIEFPEGRQLGFQLDTRGLVWDISSYTEEIFHDGDLRERFNRHHPKSDIHLSFEETCLHTAAHFLTVLTGDVCGVDMDKLLYDFDQDTGTVTVFERAEGGQGLVDLMADEIRGNPSKVLESIYRVGFDSSVIAEEIWLDNQFREVLAQSSLDDISEKEVGNAIETASEWNSPNRVVLEDVLEEMILSIDRLRNVREDLKEEEETITDTDLFELRSKISQGVLEGVGTEDIIDTLGIPKKVSGEVENLLMNQNIDGCQTLNIRTCTEEGPDTDQSSLLSYEILRKIRDQIIESHSQSDLDTVISNEGVLPAKLDDNTIESISF